MKRRVLTAWLAGVSIVTGCAERATARDDATFDVDSARGFPVVTSHGATMKWQAVPLFSVGGIEGGIVEFSSIRSVLLDSSGSLLVADVRNRSVSEFDSSGRFVRQVGRDGAGPGEFRNPYSLAWLDGNLALLDPGNPRLAVFRRDGGWVTSWPVQPLTGGQNIRLYRTPPRFWAFAYRRTGAGVENFYIQYDANGPRDSIAQARRPTDLDTGIMCNRPDKAITFFDNPFAASFLQIPLGDGRRAVARTDAYRIAFLARTGDTSLVIAADGTPAPVSDADWAPTVEELSKFHREWPTAQCNRTSFDRPAVKPVLGWMFLDGDAQLWVEVVTAEGLRYDVFDLTGRPVASVAGLPASGGLDPSITNRRAAFVVTDSVTDVPSVRVFRINQAGRGR
jgi:6-bladed beta-propeller protein